MQEKVFKIGEVAEILELKSYVLRYWETEFSQLCPLRTEKGQRLYTHKHINLLQNIKDLLHVQGMTLEGARRVLASGHNIEPKLEDAITNIHVDAKPDNISENESSSTKSRQYSVDKDELSSIVNELTTIKELLTHKE